MRTIDKKSIILIFIVASILAVSGCGQKNEIPQPPLQKGGNNVATSTPISENGETTTSSPETGKTGYEIIEPEKTDCADELDTKCWKTFVNYDYKLQLNYPAEFEYDKFDDSLYFEKKYIVYFLDTKKKYNTDVTLEVEDNKNNVTYLNFNDWKDEVGEIKPREEKQIGNYKGILIVEWDGRDSIGYYFYIIQPDKLITFRKDFNGQTIKDKKIFEKMIESLNLF